MPTVLISTAMHNGAGNGPKALVSRRPPRPVRGPWTVGECRRPPALSYICIYIYVYREINMDVYIYIHGLRYISDFEGMQNNSPLA